MLRPLPPLPSSVYPRTGFVPGYYAPEVLLPATCDVVALLQRWKQHTQGRACARLVVETLHRRHLARVTLSVFNAWRTGKGPRQRRAAAAIMGIFTQETEAKRRGVDPAAAQRQNRCFIERRAEADLNVARRTVVAAWRGSLTRAIGLRQAQRERWLKQTARRQPT